MTLTVKLNLTNTIQDLLLRLIVVKLSKTNDMKKIIGLSILTALTLISCTPIILLQQTEFNETPVGSKMVFVTVDYSKDSLFNRVSNPSHVMDVLLSLIKGLCRFYVMVNLLKEEP